MQRATSKDQDGYRRLVLAMILGAGADADLGWLRSRDCEGLLDLANLPADTGARLVQGGQFRKAGARQYGS